jgi:mercuric ion binding protein
MIFRSAVLLAALAASPLAFGEVKTVTLSVPGMNCELCPITVKKAISKVPGVSRVEASYL